MVFSPSAHRAERAENFLTVAQQGRDCGAQGLAAAKRASQLLIRND
jgi:hypothetical protein